MHERQGSGRRGWRTAVACKVVVCGVVAATLALAACTGDATSSNPTDTSAVPGPPGTAAPGGPGISIPQPTTTASTVAPTITTPEGGPAVVEYSAPERFWCMADGILAQVTVGWSVPSATGVTVQLDGAELPSGLQDTAPYQVPAGSVTGIGSTIVFPCEPDRHTITITWAMGDRSTERTFTIAKAEATR